MQSKSFDEIYDIYAVRIIVDTVAECYSALGIIHDMYHPLPNRFKDYISTPKPNVLPVACTPRSSATEGIPFEVQIRTWEMHDTAEYGVAAHWKYKEGMEGHDKLDERLAWVRQLLENQQDRDDAEESARMHLKSDLLPEEVFVFTPKGDVINLPTGATVHRLCLRHPLRRRQPDGGLPRSTAGWCPMDHIVSHRRDRRGHHSAQADKGPSRDWLKIVQHQRGQEQDPQLVQEGCAGRRTSRRAVTRWPGSCAGR